jgi:hypothetical protein
MTCTTDTIATDAPAAFGSTRTRATYDELIRRGFAPTEAANLVAHLAGLRVGEVRWTLAEVNRTLFLRHLYRSGRVGETRPRPELPAAA